MYAAKTAPAIVPKPPTITAWSSDLVIIEMKGRIKIGASVWVEKCLNYIDKLQVLTDCQVCQTFYKAPEHTY